MARKKRDFNLFDDAQKEEVKKRKSDITYLDEIDHKEESGNEREESKKDYVRHTFIIHPDDLNMLKEIVHTIKSTGHYTYTQKEALHEAISLLKEKRTSADGRK